MLVRQRIDLDSRHSDCFTRLEYSLPGCFVNVDAFLSFDAKNPVLSRFIDEDMNRVWVEERLDGAEQTSELRRARLLRPIFDQVDYLLDIHSMSTLSEPIMLCNGLDSERELTRNMG